MLPQQYCLRWKYHHSNLQTMFSQLLDRGCFCDVTLACEGQIIRAHRVVLCACSTFFDTLLSSYATEPIIIMKDAKFSDVKCLIEFMYKGEINVEHANLASLLKTAEELKIKGLAEVSWREDEFDSSLPTEPEQKFHEGSPTVAASTTTPSTTTTTTTTQKHGTTTTNTDSNGQSDDILNIPQHRIPRMPLLTPIPSPIFQNDVSGSKRKRGRPPLDESYDAFNSQKISMMKNGTNNINMSASFRDSPTIAENHGCDGDDDDNDDENLCEKQRSDKIAENSLRTAQTPQENAKNNCELKKQKLDSHFNDDEAENLKTSLFSETDCQRKQQKLKTSLDSQQINDTNSNSNDYDYYDSKTENILDDLDAENSMTTILTTAELQEWRDVIKMDAYLSRGRRPQFWEEPFTRRVMDAIKNKKLEMKKAAQVLGVSYGTLYGRYRETYGCLKHPYRNERHHSDRRNLDSLRQEFQTLSPPLSAINIPSNCNTLQI